MPLEEAKENLHPGFPLASFRQMKGTSKKNEDGFHLLPFFFIENPFGYGRLNRNLFPPRGSRAQNHGQALDFREKGRGRIGAVVRGFVRGFGLSSGDILQYHGRDPGPDAHGMKRSGSPASEKVADRIR